MNMVNWTELQNLNTLLSPAAYLEHPKQACNLQQTSVSGQPLPHTYTTQKLITSAFTYFPFLLLVRTCRERNNCKSSLTCSFIWLWIWNSEREAVPSPSFRREVRKRLSTTLTYFKPVVSSPWDFPNTFPCTTLQLLSETVTGCPPPLSHLPSLKKEASLLRKTVPIRVLSPWYYYFLNYTVIILFGSLLRTYQNNNCSNYCYYYYDNDSNEARSQRLHGKLRCYFIHVVDHCLL